MLPTASADTWSGSLDLPSELFGRFDDEVDLYEEEGEFVLSIEMPGFDRDDIDVNWYEGRLNVSAEFEDEKRGRKKTYHRTFRMPKEIEPDEIEAAYRNGVLEVRLPILEDAASHGVPIDVKG